MNNVPKVMNRVRFAKSAAGYDPEMILFSYSKGEMLL
jgi:hypothetical protein